MGPTPTLGGRLPEAIKAARPGGGVMTHGECDQAALWRELAATATAAANVQAREELQRVRAELAAVRARAAATADETRRQIERDLHDGAQQRLVSLALRLRVAQASVPPECGGLHAELGRVAAGLTSVLDELREYARGIHPAILAERGLGPALKTLACRSPVPVCLAVRTDARLPECVELTVYYVISEALTNVAKHASASAVHVDVEAAGTMIRLSVSDDGLGGADPARGSGLAGLRNRVEDIGGTLIVRSCPGEGTHLIAELPAQPFPDMAAAEPSPGAPLVALGSL
jgi:signal transduction histidine kinase